MRTPIALGLFLTWTLLASAARAQGGNDCGTPTVIAGLGTFAVNTTTATDSAQQSSGCPIAHRDVWFRWTANATQGLGIDTCGGATADTVVAVYAGSACPASGTQIACNDDACGLQSTVFFNATAGSTYMIQIGAFGASTTFSGTFNIGVGAGGCPNGGTGPDVIVGTISDVLNATAAGGLDALALGTTSCNIGNAVLQWQASNPLHPVIGATLYKFKTVSGSGRFEQIGQSWLKHGFAALTGNVCCSCNNPGTSSLLGVGCSDPYGSGLNGSQSGLGPRWQVNAHTGVFTYPPANPAWSGSTARRLEVALTDLEVSGAGVNYYGETHYVTQDDATAGNQNNNTSWTAMAVTGGTADYNFALSGSTVRMESAIRAWPLAESGVTLSDVQVASDGLFVVGSKATSLGGGQYHYEFAVYNMNADRNGGSFSVPIPVGVTVTNIGFHDVAYRNGDGPGSVNFSGTDWTASLAGGALTWSTETQAQNASANALRWSATYNFRFDANSAPAAGAITLGLWKPGTPTSVNAAAQVPGPGGPPPTFSYCPGDGSGTACPCGNNAPLGSGVGCLNSNAVGGALGASGVSSISADTFVLAGSAMPNSSCLYFQGTAQSAGGAGTGFGDGLRCAAGSVIRLGTKINAGSASTYPQGGDLAISVKGANAAGNVRQYQAWYRNAAAFCQPETFNLTNALQTTWLP